MAAAGWTRGRGEARRGEAFALSNGFDGVLVARVEGREALDVKLHVAGVFAIYDIRGNVGALAKQQGYRVYTRASAHKPVTFALISYSYACANTSAIRAAPEIGRVFSSPRDIRWLHRKAFPMAFGAVYRWTRFIRGLNHSPRSERTDARVRA